MASLVDLLVLKLLMWNLISLVNYSLRPTLLSLLLFGNHVYLLEFECLNTCSFKKLELSKGFNIVGQRVYILLTLIHSRSKDDYCFVLTLYLWFSHS